MELTYSADSINTLYENGKAMDITEYVEKYMPNYRGFLEKNGFYEPATNLVNGERRYLQLYNYYGDEDSMFSWLGYCYRRDWIVKYGKNPQTGAAFTGSYTDVDVWEDDVIFPSWYGYIYERGAGCREGGAELQAFLEGYKNEYPDWQGDYPVTISDWEWMMDIFQEAITAQNIADGYCMSLYNTGFVMTGNLVSSFGGGGVEWYKNEDGTIHFGTGESTFKTYVETMAKWYDYGWIDKSFQTHTDLFYRTDEQKVMQGKVGLWCGMDSQLHDSLNISGGDESHLTNGICVLGASYPINDKYGEAENQFKTPYCFYIVSRENSQIMITTAAKSTPEKEAALPALFTMLDYMYSEEGAATKGGGFSAEQVEETQNELYLSLGLEEGFREWDEELSAWVMTEKGASFTGNQGIVLRPTRLFGHEALVIVKDSPMGKYNLDLWVRYQNTGRLEESFISQMSAKDDAEYARVLALVREEYTKQVPQFIKGERDMGEWNAFVLSLSRLGTGSVTEMLNSYIGQ